METQGSAASVVTAYLRDAHRRDEATEWSSPDNAPGNEFVRIKQVVVSSVNKRDDDLIGMDSPSASTPTSGC